MLRSKRISQWLLLCWPIYEKWALAHIYYHGWPCFLNVLANDHYHAGQ